MKKPVGPWNTMSFGPVAPAPAPGPCWAAMDGRPLTTRVVSPVATSTRAIAPVAPMH